MKEIQEIDPQEFHDEFQAKADELFALNPEAVWVGIGQRSGCIRYTESSSQIPSEDRHKEEEWMVGEPIHLFVRPSDETSE